VAHIQTPHCEPKAKQSRFSETSQWCSATSGLNCPSGPAQAGLGFQVAQELFGVGHGFSDLGQEQPAFRLPVRAVGLEDHAIHIRLQRFDGFGLRVERDRAGVGKN
jgi:hypothetical protein